MPVLLEEGSLGSPMVGRRREWKMKRKQRTEEGSDVFFVADLAMVTITFVSAALVPLAAFFIASGDACSDVPTMKWEDACLKSRSRDKQDPNNWYQLCKDTLRNGPTTAQVTFFVLMATRKAELRYNGTMGTIDQMLQSAAKPSPPLEHCKERYGKARGLVAKIMKQLPHCEFMTVKQEYYDAHLAVQACQSELWSGYRSSPLYAAVSGDLDLTMVALQLGALMVDGR